ncbi:hypothetical protein BGZ95_004886 [Linnemannia exigua]|uniref:Uncharacterized protein n=1 Tax=Linnemannia exigua TaxID=604196 RepID=A0AAD4DHH9_9FUNG|nr:hypothetical protein BGZ95_004886 [Linnemannia exigua]
MVSHAPPAKAKQHVWKPPKETPESTKDPSTTTNKTDKKIKNGPSAKKKPEASSSAGPATYADKDKKSLLYSLDWHHSCIKEASRLAADVKREAQRLIVQFLEKLRTHIDAEVAKARG